MTTSKMISYKRIIPIVIRNKKTIIRGAKVGTGD